MINFVFYYVGYYLTIIKSRKSKSKIQKAYEADTYLQIKKMYN